MKKLSLISLLLVSFTITANAQTSRSAETIGRMMFNAVASGDVATIRSITTRDFFAREFPMDESQIRETLLSVPTQKREVLKNMGNNSIAQMKTIDKENVIVVYKNKTNGKEFTMKMKKVNGSWKIDRYGY